eukprot:scaffold258724_cov17-Tisochrysis_lutea.AAC.1
MELEVVELDLAGEGSSYGKKRRSQRPLTGTFMNSSSEQHHNLHKEFTPNSSDCGILGMNSPQGWCLLAHLASCLQMHLHAQAKQFAFAKETLLKLDDTKGLISLYVEDAHWDDAFLLLNAHPEVRFIHERGIRKA